jgi:hypothetical protein
MAGKDKGNGGRGSDKKVTGPFIGGSKPPKVDPKAA